MKFQISKNKLLQATNMVKQALAIRTTNPILKTVFIKAEDGWITFRATNTILDIEVQIKAAIERKGSCCVDSLVTDLLPTFEDARYNDNLLLNPVKISLDKRLSISQDKRKHQPVYMDSATFPPKQEIKDYATVSQDDKIKLIEALQRLATSVSTLADRPVLQGFHINPHLNFIITSDGNRVSLWEDITVPGNITTPPARIVMPILSNLLTLGDSDKLEVKFGTWSGFRAEQYANDECFLKWEIIFNSLSGDYPSTARNALKTAQETPPKLKIIADKERLKNILSVCKMYSDRAYNEGKGDYQVVLSKNGKGVMFSMNIADLVEMEEPLECEAEGENFEFWFLPGTLLETITSLKSDKAELRFFGEKSPFLLLDSETPQFSYLQVPMVKKEVQNGKEVKQMVDPILVEHHKEFPLSTAEVLEEQVFHDVDEVVPERDLKVETEEQIKTWFPEGEEAPALGAFADLSQLEEDF